MIFHSKGFQPAAESMPSQQVHRERLANFKSSLERREVFFFSAISFKSQLFVCMHACVCLCVFVCACNLLLTEWRLCVYEYFTVECILVCVCACVCMPPAPLMPEPPPPWFEKRCGIGKALNMSLPRSLIKAHNPQPLFVCYL